MSKIAGLTSYGGLASNNWKNLCATESNLFTNEFDGRKQN